MSRTFCRTDTVAQASYSHVKDQSGVTKSDSPSERSRGAQPSMATKTGKDLEDLRALLAEVQALRDDIDTKGDELRARWGVGRRAGGLARDKPLALHRVAQS